MWCISSSEQEQCLLDSMMYCMLHHGDDDSNPLRDRIEDEFPTLAARYPERMVFVWVPGSREMIRVGLVPLDFHNGTLKPNTLRDVVWRVERMNK